MKKKYSTLELIDDLILTQNKLPIAKCVKTELEVFWYINIKLSNFSLDDVPLTLEKKSFQSILVNSYC